MHDADTRRLPRGVWVTVGAAAVVLLALSARYGFHRDELYFLVAGRRLDWGYVDQPPLVPLIARLSEMIGGTTPTAIRVAPAFAVAATGVFAADIARRLGGGPRAQVFAAVGATWSGIALAVGHLLSTVAFDYLLWTIAMWLLVRLLDGADPRLWIGLGLTVGVGLLNKHLIGVLAIGILVALAVSRRRDLLADRRPWLGAALAGLIALPNFVWQVANDLPQLEMARALSARSGGPVAFVLEQIGLLSIVLTIPAAIGLWRLLRSVALARWRPIGIVFVLLFVVFLVTGGKAYYMAPLYPALLAAGALWFAELRPRGRRVMAAATAVGCFIGLFIALPLVPETALSNVDATGELGETVGWPQLVDHVASIRDTLPTGDRSGVTIFTGSYGEAGAIDVLGAERGLPEAVSGHNTYWLWGPPAAHGPIIGVGAVDGVLRRICPALARVGTIDNGFDVDNEEQGLPLFLCLEPARRLSEIWDDVRHYN